MQLILMRHGIAAPREEDADDAARTLTPQGISKTRAAAKGLRVVVQSFGLVASSPLLRAAQTAAIVGETFGAAFETWPELESAAPSALISRLQGLKAQTVLLIGHEPGLSGFASFLLTGEGDALNIELKKCGVCALDVELEAKPRARLLWHLTPRQLRLMRPRLQ